MIGPKFQSKITCASGVERRHQRERLSARLRKKSGFDRLERSKSLSCARKRAQQHPIISEANKFQHQGLNHDAG